MASKKSKYIAEVTPSAKGVDNSNEFFKEAETDDVYGMIKYTVDIEESDFEGLSNLMEKQLPKRKE